jgi:hypothetical protein
VDLKLRVAELADRDLLLAQVAKEIYLLFPDVESLSWGDLLVKDSDAIDPEKEYTVLVKRKSSQRDIATQTRLSVFIRLRLKSEGIKVINN